LELKHLKECEIEFIKMDVRKNLRIFPFVDDVVDGLYTKCEELIEKYIETNSEKSIFMMFMTMYLAVHLKLKDNLDGDESQRKLAMKQILSEFIGNPEKRYVCIEMFEKRFRTLFFETINEKKMIE
jgi:hypothetical protein